VFQAWIDPLVQPKQCNMDMSFGRLNICSLHRLGSLTTAARELTRYKLVLVCIQENVWVKDGTVRTWDFIFSMKNNSKIINC